jgi:hypothetical protein
VVYKNGETYLQFLTEVKRHFEEKKGKAVPLQAWNGPEGSVVKVKQSRYRPGVAQRVQW